MGEPPLCAMGEPPLCAMGEPLLCAMGEPPLCTIGEPPPCRVFIADPVSNYAGAIDDDRLRTDVPQISPDLVNGF